MRLTHTGSAEGFRTPGAPGYAFKDGKLYAFRRDRIVVLRGGDQPATWTKSAARPTWHSSPRLAAPALKAALRHPNRPQYQAVGLVRDCPVLGDGQLAFASFRPQFSSDLALAAFRVTIPTAIRERLRQLGFGGRQWEVYSLLARCPGALDLFDSNPALAFALANARAFHGVGRPLESVRRLLCRRQREALGWLGFPATEMARRILTKVSVEWVKVDDLFRLRRILLNDAEASKWLSHLPFVTEDVLEVLTLRREAVSMPLLQEMVAEGSLYGGLMHSLNFQAVAPLQRKFGLPWPAFRSLAALEAYGSELTRRDAAAATFRDLPDHFPPPPVLPATGCSGIRPITSPKELYQHAEKEHNCAFSFSEAISQGQYYIYAVDHPVRATLSFVRGESGWVLCDVLGPANTALPEWTREYVLSAFDELPAARQGADAELSAVCLEDSRTPFD